MSILVELSCSVGAMPSEVIINGFLDQCSWKRIENLQQFSRELGAIFKFVVARAPQIFNCSRPSPSRETIRSDVCVLAHYQFWVLLLQSEDQMSNLWWFLSRNQSGSQYLRSCHVRYVLWVFRPFQHTTFYTLDQIIDLATHFVSKCKLWCNFLQENGFNSISREYLG